MSEKLHVHYETRGTAGMHWTANHGTGDGRQVVARFYNESDANNFAAVDLLIEAGRDMLSASSAHAMDLASLNRSKALAAARVPDVMCPRCMPPGDPNCPYRGGSYSLPAASSEPEGG